MKIVVLILSGALLYSCESNIKEGPSLSENPDSLAAQLLALDGRWSNDAIHEGFAKSSLKYAADNAIEMSQNAMPLVGIAAIRANAEGKTEPFSMHWYPIRAKVSSSGDLGYTYGGWEMMTRGVAGDDTLIFGVYCTVWERQPDGSWKYLIDGGVHTPNQVLP